MIDFLTGRAAVESAFKLSRGLLTGLVFAGLFATGGLGFWRGMAAIERMVETARTEATRAADARCDAAREASNAKAQAELARRTTEAAASSAAAERAIGSLTQSLIEWETKYAQSAGADQNCISPERLDPLNRLRGHRPGAP